MFLKNEFSNRLVQVSLFSAFVYYITAYPVVFESARKYFPIKFKKTHNLLIFHTFVFAVLMYLLTYFVFDPIVRVVEGGDNGGGDDNDYTPDPQGSIGNPIEREKGDTVSCDAGPYGSGVPSVKEISPGNHLGVCTMDNGDVTYYSCPGPGDFTMDGNILKCE